jgi:hypothetical protein
MRLAFAAGLVFFLLLVLSFLLSAEFPALSASDKSSQPSAALRSAQKKIDYIERNGRIAHPDPKPTQITEAEINACLASGALQLPNGVQDLRLQGEPGVVTGNARVDFDQIRAGRGGGNPLLSVFSGTHDVVVVAHAHGADHQGIVHIDSVSLDGVEIPNFVLQLFAEKYIATRYPGIGIDSHFTLPDKIDTATVGLHEVTVTQK